jgi:RimJ/RimL family protein N-acetyltransferase
MELAVDDLRAHEVAAFTDVHNVDSRRVMERLCMTYVREFCRPGLVAGSAEIRDLADARRQTRTGTRCHTASPGARGP